VSNEVTGYFFDSADKRKIVKQICAIALSGVYAI
jgi:hypothetical protein